jgi:aminomethyltransferase
MGNVKISGKDALDFLQKVTVNDVSVLTQGKVQYSAMCYDTGGIIDDLLIYKMENEYLLVVNASNTEKDIEWLFSNKSGEVEIDDMSSKTASLAVQGPMSQNTLQKLVEEDLKQLKYYNCIRTPVAGIPAIVSCTGYTGEIGFELYFESAGNAPEKIWKAIFEAGTEFGIQPAGLGARDTLRLEMGYCLYGNDIDESVNPLEAGLGWITKLDKKEFNGRKAILKAKEEGLKKKLVGFLCEGKTLPRHGYKIMSGDRLLGTVTSGTYSPFLQKSIGMGYVALDSGLPGTEISILVRDKKMPAVVTTLPFIKKQNRKGTR